MLQITPPNQIQTTKCSKFITCGNTENAVEMLMITNCFCIDLMKQLVNAEQIMRQIQTTAMLQWNRCFWVRFCGFAIFSPV